MLVCFCELLPNFSKKKKVFLHILFRTNWEGKKGKENKDRRQDCYNLHTKIDVYMHTCTYIKHNHIHTCMWQIQDFISDKNNDLKRICLLDNQIL